MAEVYRYDNKYSGRLVVLCSDERFIRLTLKFLEDLPGIGSSDLIALPGGPEFIASGKIEPMKRMKLLIEAHGIKEIFLVSHEDCGYYNKCNIGSSKNTLDKRQADDLKIAAKKLKKLFPGSAVSGYHCRIISPGIVEYVSIL